MASTKTLTVKEVAEKFDTDGRNLRKFLRADAKANGSVDTLPGKGGRYSLEAGKIKSLQKRYDAWMAAKTQTTDTDEGNEPDGDE